jgi:hypothetical protein
MALAPSPKTAGGVLVQAGWILIILASPVALLVLIAIIVSCCAACIRFALYPRCPPEPPTEGEESV